MYKKGIVAAASFVLVVSVVACFQGIIMAKEAKIDPMKLYIKHCSDCHDKNGKPTELGAGLESTDFTDKSWQTSTTDEKIIKQIADGTPEKMMPFNGKLNLDEIKALVPVLRSFAKK
ncbi:MAG TPA: c-type cytochrome [Candidatus Wunengus sp. YC63]|uniref:c-type cytochrome n=1 Tax=unclassified Candidatus Wunengus TaxID=3367695 RepID=UPI004026A96D